MSQTRPEKIARKAISDVAEKFLSREDDETSKQVYKALAEEANQLAEYYENMQTLKDFVESHGYKENVDAI